VVSNSAVTVSGNSITVGINWTVRWMLRYHLNTPTGGGGTEFRLQTATAANVWMCSTSLPPMVEMLTSGLATAAQTRIGNSWLRGSFFILSAKTAASALDVFQNGTPMARMLTSGLAMAAQISMEVGKLMAAFSRL